MTDVPALRHVISMALDKAAGTAEIRTADGRVHRTLLAETPFASTSRLVRTEFLPPLAVLRTTTDTGDQIEYEIPGHGERNASGTGGRPTVYLDQNHWSAVSDALHGGGRPGQPEDREAALRLADLAGRQRVVLPASGGHMFETGKRFDAERRYRLGLTIAKLSRGWQMRDPVQVRRDEIHDMFRQRDGDGTGLRTTPVFTLNPDVMFGGWRNPPAPQPSSKAGGESALPPDVEALNRALICATVSIDVLLDAERTPPGPDTGWDAANRRFSDWLDNEKRDAQQKRNCVDAFLLSDLQRDVAEEAFAAGSTPEQMSGWVLGGFGRGLSRLPSAGVYREAMHQRHLNVGTTWQPNDLPDLVYLSCAAAYADITVCEGHMGGIIRQALDRLGRPKPVIKKLRDALPEIEGLLLTSGHPRRQDLHH